MMRRENGGIMNRKAFRFGIEVFLEEARDLVAGGRAGLVTHRAAVDRFGTPVLDLFRVQDSHGNRRRALGAIVSDVIGTRQAEERPVIFLDISGTGTAFGDDEEMKALVLREISNTLRWQGEEAFKQDRKLNCLVVLDEAHRFASVRRTGDESEMAALTRSFVQSVRETRKYGLGYPLVYHFA